MAIAIRAYTKKVRAAQKGTSIGVRLQPEQLAELDGWIERQADHRPTRPDAIRRLIDMGLEAAKRADQEKRP
jgi:hypothetical protein